MNDVSISLPLTLNYTYRRQLEVGTQEEHGGLHGFGGAQARVDRVTRIEGEIPDGE